MFAHIFTLPLFLLLGSASAQRITDTYTTTLDKKSLFKYDARAINFTKPGKASDAKITFDESKAFQPMVGFGATLTDLSAKSLVALKTSNNGQYDTLLKAMFDPSAENHNAGLSYLRVSLGASDLSPGGGYTYDDKKADTRLSGFSMAKANNQLTVIKDVLAINGMHVVPWSPPAWMKKSNTLNGGNIESQFYESYANYLFKAVSGYKQALGVVPYSIAIQNEPMNSDNTYPSTKMSVDDIGQIGTKLRALLDKSDLKATKIIGFEHNWSDAANFPVPLMEKYGAAFAGVSFHCYGGKFQQQEVFSSKFPDKEIYHTECTGTIGSNFSSDLKWWMQNLFIGTVEYGARSAMMWNLAGPSDGSGKLPGTNSCGGKGGCRPVVGIDNGKVTYNQEYYTMAQAQKAISPVDAGGPMGQRVQTSVSGGRANDLNVVGYHTARAKASDPQRYSMVVMNSHDSAPVKAAISFRGLEATYTFPAGITTLSWFANPAASRRDVEGDAVYVSNQGKTLPPTKFKRVHKSRMA